jgi:O-methyltransferase involved in polyketide biosynthesis
MEAGQLSRTALGAAGHRAAHQVLDRGFIFADPLAVRILGAEAQELIARGAADPSSRKLRLFIAVRTSIPVPTALTFAPVDFECEALSSGLERVGFDPHQRTFFSWLGVVPYLTRPAVLESLRYVANLLVGGEIVFDYLNPPSASGQFASASDHEVLAERVASVGEPFNTYFETAMLLATLVGLGFAEVEDLGPDQIRARFFPNYRGNSGDI